MTIEEYNICVDEFADGIYRFVLKNLKDADRSQDIVQDCYEKLWMRYSDVSFEKAKSYLFTTAYHTMIDIIRKQNRFTENNETMKEPSHTTQYTDVSEVLHQALETLPQEQKSVLLLRDYEGYSYQEIEEITGLSASQVKVYIYRARMALKEYLGSIEMVL
jgi:RNA polymerase sigma factor (sigma-70 family)